MLQEPFVRIFCFILAGAGFITGALVLSRLISPKRPNAEKNSAYESGEASRGPAWPGISTGYYVIALLFILFELEIILLFPLVIRMHDGSAASQMGWIVTEIVGFVLILSVGLAYAWANGYLDWMRPRSSRTDSFRSSVPKERYEEFNRRFSR